MYLDECGSTYQNEKGNAQCGCDNCHIEFVHYDAKIDTKDRAGKRDSEDHKPHGNRDTPSAFRCPVFRVSRIIAAVKFHEEPVWCRLTRAATLDTLFDIK